MNKNVLLLSAILLISGEVNADAMKLEEYQSLRASADRQTLDLYIEGVGMGIIFTSVFFEEEKRKPLFCLPSEKNLDSEMFISLIDQEIKKPTIDMQYEDDDDVALITIYALINQFPCK